MKSRVLIISRCSWTLVNFRLSFMKFLRSKGFDVFASSHELDKNFKHINANGFQYHTLGDLRDNSFGLIASFHYCLKVFKAIKRFNPDLIHCFTMQPILFGSLVAMFSRSKLVITITGLGHLFLSEQKLVNRLIVRYLMLLATRHASLVIFQNSDDEEFLRAKGCLSKNINSVIIGGSGVDVNYFRPLPSKTILKSNSVVSFVMVSRIIREKGISEFCEVARRIKSTYGDRAVFTIVGAFDENNPTAYSNSEFMELINQCGVRHIAHQSSVLEILQKSDVMILPSYREGLSMSLLEGASSGLPIITNDVPGCREIVVDKVSGFVVDTSNAMLFFSAVEFFLMNPDRCLDFGRASREHVVNNYSSDVVYRKLSVSYLKLLE